MDCCVDGFLFLKLNVPLWFVQVSHEPKQPKRPLFWNGWSYGIKKYGVEVIFNDMTFLLNFMVLYQLVQKPLVGTDE
jgi:hypothetical protein